MLEQSLESRTGFAHLVFPAMEKILSDAGLTLSDIDCFACSTGPGAFTGLRVALAAVKGLAEVKGKPAIGRLEAASHGELWDRFRADRSPRCETRRGIRRRLQPRS